MRLLFAFLFTFIPVTLFAQDLPTVDAKTEGMTRMDGYYPIYWDGDTGKLWLEIPRFGVDFLYQVSQPAGLGSNDIGLDRTQLGATKVVHFERVGPKVLMKEPNIRFRASSDNAAERQSVADAFAPSVVWGFTVAAATGDTVLVDATDFVVRDAHGVVDRLRGSGQGSFRLDGSRSTVYLPRTKAFPKNTEMEAQLTFTSDNPGRYVRDAAQDPGAITLRVRHSFVQLPDTTGFDRRPFDPRSGFFGINYQDYSVPIGDDMTQRYISHHRLTCAGPRDAEGLCAPSKPIVYYLDNGTPEPVRSALMEGARWWNQAFTAAGYRDAFRVEVLPEGADPMDARYNVIQWVHRATRGWSYGSSITDPRTGEIIKGHVLLGSLRVRQDYLIAEGLLSPYEGDHAAGYPPEDDPMLAMALARIRQLAAHEVGHTLGLAHNFAASTNDRASVMDYPAPLATLDGDGSIDLSQAYDTDIGEWDKIAIRYGYTDFGAGADEKEALDAILREAHSDGLRFITDTDARPAGAAHPLANLWDNGAGIVDAFQNEMAVRAHALAAFGEAAIREGRPLAQLEEALVPLYLGHRYEVNAVVKLIGGVTYTYKLRGDDQALPQPVPADRQRAALDALLASVTPEALRVPVSVRRQLPPRPPGYGSTRELFGGYTGLTFDAYAPAEVAASMVFGFIAHPERAARLVEQHDVDAGLPGLQDVLATVTDAVWGTPVPDAGYDAELQRVVQQTWTDALLDLARNGRAAPAVRARAYQQLHDLHGWLEENPGDDDETVAHRTYTYEMLDRYLFRDYQPDERQVDTPTPPGDPIGDAAPDYLQRVRRRRAMLARWIEDQEACGWGW